MIIGDQPIPFINEEFTAHTVLPAELDALLGDGWRHFGTHFFRYSYAFHGMELRRVIPLRIRLGNFLLSKSQRRVLNRNRDVQTVIGPIAITNEAERLFSKHRQRFKSGAPDSIYDFLSEQPDTIPSRGMEAAVYLNGRLVAMSFFDEGEASCSGIYAMFEPEESFRSLGIFTMLKEIEHAIDAGKQFYYQGYSYDGPSFYDYKKRFCGSEAFDWKGNWKEFDTSGPGTT